MTTIKVINDTDVGTTLDISSGKLEVAASMATDAEVAAAIAAITSHDTDWQALPLAAGIVGIEGGWQPARYCRRDNRVFVQGLIDSASAYTASQLLATLPAGFRPAKTLISVAKRHLTTCRVDIAASGTIIIVDTDAPIPSLGGGSNWINLDFSFPLD